MNETDIKKCVKHGYYWYSGGNVPEKRKWVKWGIPPNKELSQDNSHATKREALASIDARKAHGTRVPSPETPEQRLARLNYPWLKDENNAAAKSDMPDTIEMNGKTYRRLPENEPRRKGDIPVDGSQVKRFGPTYYRLVASHETPSGETQSKEVSTGETQSPREWTDIPQPLAPRKPTLAEAINTLLDAIESRDVEGYDGSADVEIVRDIAEMFGLKLRAVE